MLLQRLPDDVERKIVAVDDTLDKVEIVGHHVLEVIGDEDPPDVELDLVLLLAVLVEALAGLVVGDKQKRLEGDLKFNRRLEDYENGKYPPLLFDKLPLPRQQSEFW